jgi:hypothetical protein
VDLTAWQDWLTLGLACLAAMGGVVLTVLTLPGAWLVVLAGLGIAISRPDMVSWWVVVILAVIAGLGEAIEAAASAFGAAKAGASRHAAWASIGGSLVGAVLGIPILPPLGSIVGGALGAAAAAVAVERWAMKKEWKAVGKVGAGAAIGRLAATIAKTLVCVVTGLVLVVSVAV